MPPIKVSTLSSTSTSNSTIAPISSLSGNIPLVKDGVFASLTNVGFATLPSGAVPLAQLEQLIIDASVFGTHKYDIEANDILNIPARSQYFIYGPFFIEGAVFVSAGDGFGSEGKLTIQNGFLQLNGDGFIQNDGIVELIDVQVIP